MNKKLARVHGKAKEKKQDASFRKPSNLPSSLPTRRSTRIAKKRSLEEMKTTDIPPKEPRQTPPETVSDDDDEEENSAKDSLIPRDDDTDRSILYRQIALEFPDAHKDQFDCAACLLADRRKGITKDLDDFFECHCGKSKGWNYKTWRSWYESLARGQNNVYNADSPPWYF